MLRNRSSFSRNFGKYAHFKASTELQKNTNILSLLNMNLKINNELFSFHNGQSHGKYSEILNTDTGKFTLFSYC